MSFVTHLESAIDGTQLPADRVQTMYKNRPLWVRYDLDAIRRAVRPSDFAARVPNLWRYRELLPIPDDCIVSLGEGVTPLLPARRLGKKVGLSDLWIKDESHQPTGSFKSRGMALAVSLANHFGLKRLVAPTAGNAGAALSAYGARAGMEVFVLMPADTPGTIQHECGGYGAKVFLVEGLITDCARIVREGKEAMGWFDVATLKEPYRIEGKKTMGLELTEQCAWKLPDVILYQTGGGTGIIGMWKAFKELRELGWLQSETMPRMIAVQSAGCAPIVRAVEMGTKFAETWQQPATTAWGIRVPAAIGDFMILETIRESHGTAVAVREEQIAPMQREASALEGISFCPETSACFLAAQQLLKSGLIHPEQRVVVFNTGTALKYLDAPAPSLSRLRADIEVDYQKLAQ